MNHIQRIILFDKPRVTKFPIDWNAPANAPQAFVEQDIQNVTEPMQTEEEDTFSNWLSLEPRFFKMIFQFLGIWDLVECRRVCKPWKQIVDSGSLLA